MLLPIRWSYISILSFSNQTSIQRKTDFYICGMNIENKYFFMELPLSYFRTWMMGNDKSWFIHLFRQFLNDGECVVFHQKKLTPPFTPIRYKFRKLCVHISWVGATKRLGNSSGHSRKEILLEVRRSSSSALDLVRVRSCRCEICVLLAPGRD